MLNLNQIKQQYPEQLHSQPRFLLREYLQHKLLELISHQEHGRKLVFMGGTAIRLFYSSQRFSEDLDFDNQGLTQEQFEQLLLDVAANLELEGLATEARFSHKEAFHCYLKFTDILQQLNLTKQKKEKILIRIDTTGQDYQYQPQFKILNKFDVFARVPVSPADLLLAQKLTALLGRKRAKGRDFYDTVFLAGQTKPDYNYLQQKVQISSSTQLKKALKEKIAVLDLELMADDVTPFLMKGADRARVEQFDEFVEQWLD